MIPKAALQLTPTITPNDATNQKVDWSSSDPTVAAVDKSGKVTAIKVGTAAITANTEDGNKTASCAVTVVDGQGAIVINNVKLKNKLALAAGKDSDYEGYFTPDDLASIKGTIDLSNLDITDSDMDVMKYLKGVSAINLSDNKDLTNSSFKKLKFDWIIPKGLDFSGCTGMKDIKNNMFAFASSKLTSIKLPVGISSIPTSCFSNSKLLASVEISNTVKSVGNLAFSGCTSLAYMKIPGSVTQLGSGCFSGCTNLSVLDLTDTSLTKDNIKDTKCPDSTMIICGKNVKLSPGQISIKIGGVQKIANEIPSGKSVLWGSTDANVVKVSSEGVITGVNPGTAYIYAKTDDDSYGGVCTVTVTKDTPPQPVSVTGISLDRTSASMAEGDTLQLTAAVTPQDATNKKVDWSSSDKTIAAVDENGKVTAVKSGAAAITAVSEDNNDAKAQCTVTVMGNNMPKPIQITNLTKDSSFKLGNDVKVSVKAENNSGKDQDASLLVALYDEGGKFINYVCGKQTIKMEIHLF
ncbi:Ig-like domain-containing protein [Clostridium ljungdahlii]